MKLMQKITYGLVGAAIMGGITLGCVRLPATTVEGIVKAESADAAGYHMTIQHEIRHENLGRRQETLVITVSDDYRALNSLDDAVNVGSEVRVGNLKFKTSWGVVTPNYLPVSAKDVKIVK